MSTSPSIALQWVALSAEPPMSSSKTEAVRGSLPHDPKTSTDSYFGDAIYDSPVDSGTSDSDRDYLDEDDDAHTDSTLDDKEGHIQFGHPLERMPRCKSADHGIQFNANESVGVLLNISRHSSRTTSQSGSVTSLSSTMAYDSMYANSSSLSKLSELLIEIMTNWLKLCYVGNPIHSYQATLGILYASLSLQLGWHLLCLVAGYPCSSETFYGGPPSVNGQVP